MLTSDEVADLVGDLVEARMTGDAVRVVDGIHGLTKGPRGDALNAALLLAGLLALDLGDTPEQGFHHIEVTHLDERGRVVEGSTLDLPRHVATFLQMVVAVANGERDLARDLFLGYVGVDAHKALLLLALGLNEVVHQNGTCPSCDRGSEVRSWTD